MKTFPHIADPALAKALTHPLRARILTALEGRTASPSELAAELGAPLGVTSYHVRRLEALGFLKLVKRVPRRGALEHYYRAKPRAAITDGAWTTSGRTVKQATVAAALEDVGRSAVAAAGDGGFNRKGSQLAKLPVRLDAQGWRELSRELDAMLKRIPKLEAASRKRLGAAKAATGQQASVVVMLFEDPEGDRD